jgi:hypothetical protein
LGLRDHAEQIATRDNDWPRVTKLGENGLVSRGFEPREDLVEKGHSRVVSRFFRHYRA